MKIEVRSPTRVDLAGGTLDLWPLYLFVGGARTVNVAIDIFTKAIVEPTNSSEVVLESLDLKKNRSYKNLQECLQDGDPQFHLLRAVVNFWKPTRGFKLQTQSFSPIGGGLGGSSSLTISIMKALEKFVGTGPMQAKQMVQISSNIEAEVLNTPTGTQDYFPAFSGGINLLDYSYEGVSQEVIALKDARELTEHFMLLYTGKSHHSGLNNFEVVKKAVSKDAHTLRCLHSLKDIAEETAEVCQSGKWLDLPKLFQREYKARVELEPAFSGPEIRRLHDLSLQAGGDAVKICGAGGGGCVLVWCDPAKQRKVEEACAKEGFQTLPAKLVDKM